MTNKEKFLALVSDEQTNTAARNKERIKNRARLRESQAIGLKVLNKLEDLGWTQKKLAEELSVSPQQISKIVKGKENLTLETQIKIQAVLNIPILASFYEHKIDLIVKLLTTKIKTKTASTFLSTSTKLKGSSNTFQMEFNRASQQYAHYPIATAS